MALLDYIHKYRIEQAKQLLRTADEQINKVDLNVGYNNIRTFNRIFKKYANMTPGEFKSMFE